MNKKEALLKAIRLIGGQSQVARNCDIKQSSVAGWIKRGYAPPTRVVELSKQTGNKITCRQLCPELYPAERIKAYKPKSGQK